MRLYNSLSQQIEEINPINPPVVTVYTCGPTVYYYPHIGNWFTFIRYDLLIRSLKAAGFQPKWVMNITDVGHLTSDSDEGEDKLQKGARQEGKNAWEIAASYTNYFEEGMQRLNFLKPSYLVKATDHIAEQIEFIKKLEGKDYTYVIDDGVYYDTSKFTNYAKFARLDIDEQQPGKRFDLNPQKRQLSDFALWKFSPSDVQRDMEWDSPWGKGFPGWHIECSAMAMKYLGETLDIHAGGIDHIPIHHTNEIAQSEALSGKPLAQIWMHSNHITIEGQKIAKSAGNGITLEDLEKRNISLASFRLHVLESHYRSQSKFSWKSLQSSQTRLLGFYAMADLVWQTHQDARSNVDLPKAVDELTELMSNDLDSPATLAKLSTIQNNLETSLLGPNDVLNFKILLATIEGLLGIQLQNRPDISLQQKDLIKQRQQAREIKDWAESDKLRDVLESQLIGIRDTPFGPVWYRLK